MTLLLRVWPLLSVVVTCLAPPALGAIESPAVERAAPEKIVVRWKSDHPVDVFLATRPDAPVGKARLAMRADRDNAYQADWTDPARPYVILRDGTDGQVVRVAERLLPLDRGSNFRDIGGYPGADGKHVRWGLIYRTAAAPMLDDADYRYISRLGIREDIDLRTVEERQIAPDHLGQRTSARYFAIDYPGGAIFGRMSTPGSSRGAAADLYREWPISLAPQYREIFRELLRHDGAVAYHCSAGQDRTGLATALVLAALGVPRDVILEDYHLSTADRRPENEIPPIRPGEYPGNIVADFYLKRQDAGVSMAPRPLYDAMGHAYLQHSFDEIEAKWGSVDNYLDKVLGVDAARIAKLRALYLE